MPGLCISEVVKVHEDCPELGAVLEEYHKPVVIQDQILGEPTPVSYTHLDVYKRQPRHGVAGIAPGECGRRAVALCLLCGCLLYGITIACSLPPPPTTSMFIKIPLNNRILTSLNY